MLDVQYQLEDLHPDAPVRVVERRGSLRFDLCRGLFLPEGVAALNSAARLVLAGGQWFQLWRGEIVGMATPEPGGRDAGLHRGPLAHQTTGPQDR